MVIQQFSNTLDSHLESNSDNQQRFRGSITYLHSKRYHMAQSAVKERALLGFEPFWEKPTLEPPLGWDRWQIMLKLAILAKEGISIDTLCEDPLDKVIFPPEPVYEDNVENSTTQSERDRKTGNEQLKNAWLIKCQKIELAGILCGDKPWKFCDNKAVSLTYLSIGMEGRRVFGSQEPNIQIDRVLQRIYGRVLIRHLQSSEI